VEVVIGVDDTMERTRFFGQSELAALVVDVGVVGVVGGGGGLELGG
jgi:hypothetical protein